MKITKLAILILGLMVVLGCSSSEDEFFIPEVENSTSYGEYIAFSAKEDSIDEYGGYKEFIFNGAGEMSSELYKKGEEVLIEKSYNDHGELLSVSHSMYDSVAVINLDERKQIEITFGKDKIVLIDSMGNSLNNKLSSLAYYPDYGVFHMEIKNGKYIVNYSEANIEANCKIEHLSWSEYLKKKCLVSSKSIFKSRDEKELKTFSDEVSFEVISVQGEWLEVKESGCSLKPDSQSYWIQWKENGRRIIDLYYDC